MNTVIIEGTVEFAINLGVLVTQKALQIPPEQLQEYIALAFTHINDEVLDAARSYEGPLVGIQEIDFSDYLPIADRYHQDILAEASTITTKRTLSKRRRAAYSAQRDALALALIEQGIPYVCNDEECNVMKDLTLDHVIPLSRGGTDDLSNLQFLCRRHNGQKSDKVLCPKPEESASRMHASR